MQTFFPQTFWPRKVFETIWKLKSITYQKGSTKWVPDFHSEFWNCLRFIKFSSQQKEWKTFCVLGRNIFPSDEEIHKLFKALFLSFRAKLLCFHNTFLQLQFLSRNDLSTFLLLQLDGNFLVSKNQALRKYLL